MKNKRSRWPDSNQRQMDLQSTALPTELQRVKKNIPTPGLEPDYPKPPRLNGIKTPSAGLEPATYRLTAERSAN